MSAQQIQYAKKGVFTALAIFLAGYLFVILLTYTPNDPSWSHISSDMGRVSNMGGITGAWIADLLYMFFGWFAWFWLAIIAYEATHLWWQRQQPVWILRWFAYVFLFFAGSALCAEIGAFIGEHSQALSAKTLAASLHTGGIIGVEVSSRLAHLLTALGSLVFLLLFFVVAITYAFNIHWLALLNRLGSLTWLGSGIKHNQDTVETSSDAQSQLAADESMQTQQIDKYGQLSLTLPEQTSRQHYADGNEIDASTSAQTAVENNTNTKGVLEEFLENSGLRETILQFRQQEKEEQEQAAEHDSEQMTSIADTVNVAANGKPVQQDSPVSVINKKLSAQPAAEKIEPSFAWNNPQAIDELLTPKNLDQTQAQGQAQTHTEDTSMAVENTEADLTASFSEPVETQASEQVAANVPSKFEPQSQTQTDAMVSDPQVAVTATDENASMQAVSASTQQSYTDEYNLDDNNSLYKQSTKSDSVSEYVSDSVDIDNVNINKQASQPEPELEPEQQQVMQSFIDLTPSNTPPADPTKAPVSMDSEDAAATEKVSSSTQPIRFAVPEGDDSNHITEMVPDDEATSDAPSMPSIDDDAAFVGRSRAMQTAKYREQLTPIPEISILDKPDPDRKPSYTVAELEQLSELLEIKLQEFNVKAEVVNAIPGPVVTRFEVDLAAGVKASKVTNISRDLARSLSMASLRVVEVIPGKPYIGIEVPNKKREMVRLIELLDTDKYKDPKAQISMAMGKDIGGKPIITDLAKAPHMLVAGTTGSGKSVLVNAMLLSILLKYKPDELRLILIDPKQLELANYNDIPHLLTPVVTDMNEAASSLSWCVAEMERRYQLMSLLKVRKLGEFNKKVIAAEKAGKPMIDPLWRPNDSVSIDQAPKLKTLPMIVIVADEFADMIMQVGKQAEELITRLAQKSRAAGIHLMLATQRPSVDVITGLIKANIPVRAALRVNSKVDSRTILDSGGAEDMLGNGDMLFLGPGQIEPDRVHGAYVSDEEVNRVCDAWRERGAPDYIDNMASNFELASPSGSGGNTSGEDDDLYDEAVAFVMETRKVSASSIQRKFSIGYNRAARIVDSMEEAGLVSAMGKSGKRELLI